MTLSHLRPWLLISVIILPILLLGFQSHHRDALIFSLAVSLALVVLILNYGRWRLLPRLDLSPVEGHDPWGLSQEVSTLCERTRLPRPKLYILDTPEAQAVVLGNRPKHAAIIVTQGLIEILTPKERSAVIAYLLACIRTRATLSFTVGSALADILLGLGHVLDRVLIFLLGRMRSSAEGEVIHFGTLMIAPLAGLVLRIAVGRSDYFAADHLAASWVGEPEQLAKALWKLHSYALTTPLQVNPATSVFFIVNPLTRRRWARYFRTHPRLEDRIKSLVGFFPV